MVENGWTLGMAITDKPPEWVESIRASFTAQSALIHHPLVREVLIVDNAPSKNNPLIDLAQKSDGRIRYIEHAIPVGTAAPRNRVFQEARQRRVAVIDPHVLMYPGFFESLNEMYDGLGKDCPDLLHGPMMTEALGVVYGHHMNDQWRCEMWGTWGRAWQAPDGFLFSCIKIGNTQQLEYVLLGQPGGQRSLEKSEIADHRLPFLAWDGHEALLTERGFKEPSEPFLIPDHGMGFFACLKDKWLPFHKDCEGFGGEEMTTGYRFRRAGRSVWCVPGARWWHHFYRANNGAVPYTLTKWHKMRNYVLEFQAMSMDPTPIHDHFVKGGLCPEGEWKKLMDGMRWPDLAPGVDPSTYSASVAEAAKRMNGVPLQGVKHG